MTSETSAGSRVADLSKEIQEILIAKAGVDREAFADTDDVALRNLDIDSLAVLQLQAVVIDRFGVEIPEEAINMTVPAIAAYVENNTRTTREAG